VFNGEFDMRVPAAMKQVSIADQNLFDGRVNQAINDSSRAVDLAPENGLTHYSYCTALTAARDFPHAEQECMAALKLFQREPEINRIGIDAVTNFMQTQGLGFVVRGSL
jgi:hypothetical protein